MKKHILRALSAVLILAITIPMPLLCASADAVSVGGEMVNVGDGEAQVTLGAADAKLLYTTVTLADGTRYTTADTAIDTQEDMQIDAKYVKLATLTSPEARLCMPLGLRYVTALSAADYAALAADESVKEIRVGTLIAPEETVRRVGGMTKVLLADEVYIDVPATAGMWYDESDDTVFFAGSIVDIKEEHYNLALVGVGYVEVELEDGSVYTVYGAQSDDLIASGIATEAKITLRDATLDKSEQYYMNVFADAFDGDMEMLYNRDFTGLNVLAIGDNLFSGAFETIGDKVWVNLLGKKYGWNLTNLGISGAAVSYDSDRTATNASMYGLLMNDADYKFGSPSYYNAGNPSGNPEDVDLILLEGGSNDYDPKVGAPQGTVASTDPADFLGAWRLMTDELLHRYPNATIVFVTAWENVNQTREDGANSIIYTSAVKNLYRYAYKNNARVYMIDAGDPDVSGVDMVNDDGTPNTAFKSQYAYDRYHLNDAGMGLMAGNMLPLIWDLVVEAHRTPRTKVEQMQYDLNSLNVLALGDSLFTGSDQTTGKDVWINSIGKDCFWNITNLGIGGATISYDPNRTATNASIYKLLFNDETYKFGSRENSQFYNSGSTVKPKEAVDVILLEAGSNDYGTKVQAPMGTVDSDDPATFLGAWQLVTEELLRQYPNAIVIFITAWENNNQTREDGANAIEYTSSVVTLYDEVYADNDRVYLIDAGDPDVSGVNMRSPGFKSFYAYDAFHLNDEGMALMAKNMLPLIWDVIKNQAKIR